MNTSNKNATQDLRKKANTKNNIPGNIRVYVHLRTYIKQPGQRLTRGEDQKWGSERNAVKTKHNTKLENSSG